MNTQLILGADLYTGDMLFIAILFVILMWAIAKVAWNPINKMLQERSDRIANDLDSAKASREEAAELADQRKAALDNSHQEATTIINNAKQSGENERSLIVDNAHKDADSIKSRANQEIELQRQEALDSAKKDIASLSIEIASKVIQKELDVDGQKQLIDSYIEGLGDNNESK